MSPVAIRAAVLGTLAGLTATHVALAEPAPLRPVTHTTIAGSAWAQPAGDVNGDGREDLMAVVSCTATVIFGSTTPSTVDVSAPGDRGFQITSSATDCGSGWTPVGDTNGDGREDLAAKRADGAIWVVYGQATTTPVDLRTLGTGGLRLFTTASGVNPNLTLGRVAALGDVNGDGRDDIGIEGRIREPGVADARPALGVVFGPATGGALDVGNPSTPGLLIANSRREDGQPQPYRFQRIGDVNRDGREDLFFSVARPAVDRSHLLLGRATPGVVDVSTAPTVATFPNSELSAAGDLNGDGLQEQSRGSSIALTSTASPYLDLGSTSRLIQLTASNGTSDGVWDAGEDVTGDGRRDIIASASFGVETSTTHLTFYRRVSVPYIHTASTASTVDLRTGARRVDGLAGGTRPEQMVRFTGRTTAEVIIRSQDATRIATLETAPPDTTPPALDNVRFDKASILRTCSADCAGREQTHLLYRVSEPVYLELTLQRGSTVVGTGRGAVDVTSDDPWASFRLSAVLQTGGCGLFGCTIGYQRLPAGTYTATLRGTDRAGNRSATRTATVVVQ